MGLGLARAKIGLPLTLTELAAHMWREWSAVLSQALEI